MDNDKLDELISKYDPKGKDLVSAVANAEQQVFDHIRATETGVPLELMYQVLDLWMEWSMRLISGTIMAVASDINKWTLDEQNDEAQYMIQAFSLLKQDAFKAILEMAGEPGTQASE